MNARLAKDTRKEEPMDKALNLSKVLSEHEKWLNGESGGKQGNFTSHDLSGVDLRGMNLEARTI